MAENIMQDKIRKIGRLLQVIAESAHVKRAPVQDITHCVCGYKTGHTPPPLAEMQPFAPTDVWGQETDTHAWFHFTATVPEEFAGLRAELVVQTEADGWNAHNPQFILYVNGTLRQGLDTNHRTCLLTEKENDIWLYAYTGSVAQKIHLDAYMDGIDEDAERLFYHIRVPFMGLDSLHINSKEYMDTVQALDHALLLVDFLRVPSTEYYRSLKAAIAYLDKEFYGKQCHKGQVRTVGIGHTHIDCAWRWTLQQSREKVQRSFATVLEMMRRDPDYKFMSSQALLYQYLKEEAPQLYEQVKQRVKEGRWEVEGAMWVEADCNLTSGESLVRQVMYGKRFFQKECGVDTRVLWLPDVFGYSAALPQILKKSGVDWFLTSKISWNECNQMPYDVFSWHGIDGTAINAYFLTAQDMGHTEDVTERYTTYVGFTRPQMIAGTWNRFQQKHLTDEALLTFGWGDGGGGPTMEMLEELKREKAGLPGLPTATNEFAGDFLRRLEKKIDHNPDLPVWRGELYLEFHRGTYTSQANNKKNNRECELLFQDTECLCQTANLLLGLPFPKEELHRGWEDILTNQFHDIIPGSSIREVYEQSDRDYARLRAMGNGLRDGAQAAIAAKVAPEGDKVLVFNPHSFAHSGAVQAGGKTVWVENIPAKGWGLAVATDTCSVTMKDRVVTTPFYRVRFDKNWQIASLYDKKQHREVLSAPGNVLEIYEDFPYDYDAWELSVYHKEKHTVITDVQSVEPVQDGCRFGVRIRRKHMESTVCQTIWFYDRMARIDFETTVDWQQTHQIMKVAFPVTVNPDKASYEVQFGTVERPTHSNTSWDRMKFEVCAQKYADLSDNGYGVSLLNNCKYGHDIHDGVIRLSLLKAAVFPDPIADKGMHTFTYSLYPHAGTLRDGDTLRQAYDLNLPMRAVRPNGDGTLPARFSLLRVSAPNVIAETVKMAEDGEDTVVRMYEAKNMSCRTTVSFGFPVEKVFVCDLLENPVKELTVRDGAVHLDIRPFEIVTLKVQKKA